MHNQVSNIKVCEADSGSQTEKQPTALGPK
jgi:hypothetical protein